MAPRRGSYFLYDLALGLAALLLLPFVALRSLLSISFRQGVRERMGFVPSLQSQPRVLLHGVSVGEVRAMRPLVAELRLQYPDLDFVISSTTRSGIETAHKVFPHLTVVRFPVDLRGVVSRFLKRVKPTSVILVELEIWPNFLRACDHMDIHVAILNGRITEKSIRGYRRVQRFLPQFDRIALYGVQNDAYAQRFRSLNVPPDRIRILGNLKYDMLPTEQDALEWLQSPWKQWLGGASNLALASTHESEEVDWLTALAAEPRFDAYRLVVVPRHPKRVEGLLPRLQAAAPQRQVLLRSQLQEGKSLPQDAILLVDTFGELELIFRSSQVAFLGGSLIPHGGQNVLEPAALGCPVLIGPHFENFIEEVELLQACGGLKVGECVPDLIEFALNWLEQPDCAIAAGQLAAEVLTSRRGSSRKCCQALAAAGLLPTP
ncbi:MAG: hypothetical protein HOM34_05940 [Planctomycetes bacterium]|jgi:3-deoxy-D-manno-octulosonic-acid transferase|nr:hypothetical protein [Planctomycetota bacterium]MBT4029729.1 hypothetical protein [Planctomycetota bacterium]MBT4561229.1 hypothetical protein [Planctomycetota bacterium]MBT5102209.1 hypothetical protein [Planctomycetota bacterium]MBT5120244.1 hypothetical protein [Planctomycetota bacterium]